MDAVHVQGPHGDEPRFAFGNNWRRFLSTLDDERMLRAEHSLRDMLGVASLDGKTFLDVGSGSGLFSLAAMRLGARRVHSFDYDAQSVACTRELERRYFPTVSSWSIEPGSALDRDYLSRLGLWDVVYSWGVLHHTGNMWSALDNVAGLVAEGGRLFISIYNDQGPLSRMWTSAKRFYNRGRLASWLVVGVFVPYFVLRGLLADAVRFRDPTRRYRTYKNNRGMSVVHDWIDWLGGYPFEVAKPEEIFDFFRGRGFELLRLKTVAGSLGCNQFVFGRKPLSG
jgi:2-polyprenyl-6-hydroxyphenyl methylase/3-demethylubiquinone-9 3-methyltransferase